MKNKLIFAFTIIAILACSKKDGFPDGTSQINDGVIKVLFIGNSHTHFNSGLPIHVKGFASSYSIETHTSMSAPGGFTLQDHLNHQPTLDLVNSENWDAIVLQENTFRAVNEPELMLESIEEFDDLFRNSSAMIYLFKTWAYQPNPEMLPLLDEVYDDARILSGFTLVSVGNLWKSFMNSSTISLYDSDGVHPNPSGTYFTAGLFFKKLFNVNIINSSSFEGVLETEEATTIKAFISNANL